MKKKNIKVKMKTRMVVAIISGFMILSAILGGIYITSNSTSAPTTEAALTRRRHLRGGGTYAEAASSRADVGKALASVPDTWDLNKVYPVLSEDGIYVPVPKGWTISTSEDERYVNGNVTKKGTLSNLTFTSTGDYPWTQNSDNIWVSGNKQQPNSISELVSNEIEIGPNGGWVEVEWSVCSESRYDVLYMYINDTINSTSELIGEITGTPYGTAEASLIYTKCGIELSQGTYTVSVKYDKYNATHSGLDSGYVKSGLYIDYDENGANTLDIHKTGGFVIYEGNDSIDDLWTASKERNQFVWVPVTDTSRIYEINSTTGKINAKLWNFTASGSTSRRGIYEPTVAVKPSLDRKLTQGMYKDMMYKDFCNEFSKTMISIEKYGGFYIGRYETGDISQTIPVVRRLNTNVYSSMDRIYNIKNISNNSNIQTNQIWGCLWDETMNWLIESGEKTIEEISNDSSSWGNYKQTAFKYTDARGQLQARNRNGYYSFDFILPTGSCERNSANNIYDLAGNCSEETLELNVGSMGLTYGYRIINKGHVIRGGYMYDNGYALPAGARYPSEFYQEGNTSYIGTRAYMYIN